MRSTILSTSVITLLLTTLASAVPVSQGIPDDVKGYSGNTLPDTTLDSVVSGSQGIPDDVKGYSALGPRSSISDQFITVLLYYPHDKYNLANFNLNTRLDYSVNTDFEPMKGGKAWISTFEEVTGNVKCYAFSDKEGTNKIGKSFERGNYRKFKKNETVQSIRCGVDI
jgi:hypothetical protein